MPIVTYSALRFGLFGACFGLLVWAGLRGWPLVLGAALAAWALSYVAFAGPRNAAELYLAQRSARRSASGARFTRGVEADAAAEDAAVDATHDPSAEANG